MQIIALLQDPTYPNKIVLEKLICAICGWDKTTLFTHYDRELSDDDYSKIQSAYEQVEIHKQPLDYAIGFVTFDHKQFIVSPSTLIPRPETEYMIVAVKDYLASTNIPHTLLDLGTGCGVLGICAYLAGGEKITHAYLTDVSEDALVVARQNVARHIPDATNITVLASDMFDHPTLQKLIPPPSQGVSTTLPPFEGGYPAVLQGGGLLIVANLPYIPEDLFDNNVDDTVKKREPKFAFVGWVDGLDRYRIMFDTLASSPSGTSVPLVGGGSGWGYESTWKSGWGPILFLEMMTRQVDLLRQAYGETWHFEEVQTFHFNIRIVKVRNRQISHN